MRAATRAALTVLVFAVGGCSLAPDYVRPEPAIPANWPTGDAYRPITDEASPAPTVGYRELFQDPRLRTLIERALANNQDLRVALANVEAARGTLRVQRAALFPQVGVSTGVTTGRSSTTRSTSGSTSGSTTASGRRVTSYEANIGLTAFELDLFGRVRSLSEAALQEYLGTESAVRTTRLALVGEVASAYVGLATDRSLLTIARETEVTASRSVDLTRARLSGGIAPRTDVRQAETILATARSDLAATVTLVAQDRNTLELLLGGPVTDTELPESIESIDGLFAELPAGLDSRVLLRRPDVANAEYTLRAANARIGAARAAFFPTISLTAAAGLASSALSTLATGGAFAWSVGPTLSLPIFDAGVREGRLQIAEADREATVAQYQKAVQTAFREVADALARRGTIDDQLAAQTMLENAARDTSVLAEARYRQGVDSFLVDLDAQRTLYTARRALANTRGARAENLIAIFRTLGGGTE